MGTNVKNDVQFYNAAAPGGTLHTVYYPSLEVFVRQDIMEDNDQVFYEFPTNTGFTQFTSTISRDGGESLLSMSKYPNNIAWYVHFGS